MPDGDIVHNKLGWRYQKPYKSLCEGKASTSECAWAVMKALKEDLKQKGDIPVVLAQRMGEKLSQLVIESGKNGSVDWTSLSMKLEKIAQQANGSHYLKELVLSAGKSFLQDLRYGREVDIKSASEIIVRRYMNKVYESEFKERIPLTSTHHAGIDGVVLTNRIEQSESDIKAGITNWAKQANRDGSVAKLRLPNRRQVNTIDMDEDLL